MHYTSIPIDKNNEDKRLDSLCKKIVRLPYSAIMTKIRKKSIRINGKPAKASTKLYYEDSIDFAPSLVPFLRKDLAEYYVHKTAPKETPSRITATKAPFPILFQNRDFLCLEKQQEGTLFGTKSITEYLHAVQRENGIRQEQGPHLGFRPGPCHRLDRNTSGLLLCAKSLAAARKMQTLQSNDSLLKIYFGILEIDSKEPERQKKRVLDHELYRSSQNVTHVFPLGEEPEQAVMKRMQLRHLGRGTLTLQPLFPVQTKASASAWCYGMQIDTGGKTHQIRAQCEYAKMPLLGDRKYNERTKSLAFSLLPPAYFLHAAVIVQKPDADEEKTDEEKRSQLPVSLPPRTLVSPIPQNWHNYFKDSKTRRNFEKIQECLTSLEAKLQDDSFFTPLLRRSTRLETGASRVKTDLIAVFSSMFGRVRG